MDYEKIVRRERIEEEQRQAMMQYIYTSASYWNPADRHSTTRLYFAHCFSNAGSKRCMSAQIAEKGPPSYPKWTVSNAGLSEKW